MRWNGLLPLIFASLGLAQVKDTSPRELDLLISQTREEICPEKRLDYVAVYGETVDSVLVLKGETSHAVFRDSLVVRSRRVFPRVQDAITLLPAPSLGKKTRGILRVSTGFLRRQPDHDMEMISQGLLGEPVTLLKRRGAFYFIKLEDGYLGWMESASVQEMDQEEFSRWQAMDQVIYLGRVATIYSEKNERSDPISDIVGGCRVARLKKQGKWMLVQLPDGRTGYLRTEQVSDYRTFRLQPQPSAERLVQTARQFIGIPYLWGGNSAKGFDCSGLTRIVYQLHHIALPRDANMQVHAGSPVAFDSTYQQLKPADLLFFGANPQRITHVALYIGNRQFIHSDGLVRINSFNPADKNYSNHRVKGLQAVRRILSQ
ncbi:MAG TPA: NlpC/P60 family protein [bacterium]|nr:NlpC/P60 family protein [bacterium]HPN34271.1 NlpC/P60 family protein [bacterium]